MTATLHVTEHAIDRYIERRGWNRTDADARAEARTYLLDLWSRCEHQSPPIRAVNGETGRRYRAGQMWLVTDVDVTTLITFYPCNGKAKGGKPRKLRKRRGM